VAQIRGANLDRARQCRGAGKHARANLKGRQRPAPNGGDVAGRNPRIDGEVTIRPAHHHRAVHQRGATEKFRTPVERQQYRRNARRDQIPGAHEAPVCRLILHFDDHLVGWFGRPSDVLIAVAPVDPCRPPDVVRNPEPAVISLAIPPSIVIGDPTPIGLLIIGDPVPAVVIGVDPVTDRIGTPVTRPTGRDPHVAEAPVVAPAAIGFERDTEVGSDRHVRLRLCRRHDRADRPHNRKCSSKTDQQGGLAKRQISKSRHGILSLNLNGFWDVGTG
jgi:hypothetical protein